MGGTYSKVAGVPDLVQKPRLSMGMGMMMMRKKAAKKTMIADGRADVTQTQVATKEKAGWMAKGDAAWASFQKARPYSLEGYISKAPVVGASAPDGPVHPLQAGGEPTTFLKIAKGLAEGNGKVAIIFGCATCPAFRVFTGYDLHKAFAKLSIPVLYVYMREAHGHDDFESPMNLDGPFALNKTIDMHKDIGERRAAAILCHAHLVTQHGGKAINMIIDDMDDGLEAKYEARPHRAYVIDSAGKIVYAGGVCPFNMAAKLADIAKIEV
mmetsp:Transcript_37909/g.63755  ORF Transcript_37909/g.63755 Transcript_37909/m.63755 type:complete len:268 (-) Transcript_37909:273-1076(-)|eukprot:CAMPEP_0198203054 /NCGR_PEP_ID=MMETSP1445-20131203/6296_1 /TAXON_ID=36898 /ORGANISM="Pyramimonas sp., Strain CCMP2087" /LENGTH=267 /DNA_ID=CAMNT_0043874275 /DNA_START=246 /DNA_END=1049 /DNA_ORIENTATION=-